jgi:hypothetical protein
VRCGKERETRHEKDARERLLCGRVGPLNDPSSLPPYSMITDLYFSLFLSIYACISHLLGK